MFVKYRLVNISDNQKFPNIKLFESNLFKGGITLPGIGIIVSNKKDIALIQHEYGHYLDFKNYKTKYGTIISLVVYYCYIGLPSLYNSIIDKIFNRKTHTFFYAETRADNLAKAFFERKYLTDSRFSTFQKP